MVTKEKLKDYAARLMFDMDDEGYERTLKEFETIEKHMALIGKIKNIEKVEPMTFPYVLDRTFDNDMRKDEAKKALTNEEVLCNTDDSKANQIKVPKVVG